MRGMFQALLFWIIIIVAIGIIFEAREQYKRKKRREDERIEQEKKDAESSAMIAKAKIEIAASDAFQNLREFIGRNLPKIHAISSNGIVFYSENVPLFIADPDRCVWVRSLEWYNEFSSESGQLDIVFRLDERTAKEQVFDFNPFPIEAGGRNLNIYEIAAIKELVAEYLTSIRSGFRPLNDGFYTCMIPPEPTERIEPKRPY